MKALKTIGIIILIIIALVIIISLFLPRKVHVERTITVNASQVVIFDQVNAIKNMEFWSPWYHLDTAMETYYMGPPSGEGAIFHWDSKNPDLGVGKILIRKSVPCESIEMDLDMQQCVALMTFSFVPEGAGTRIVWGIDGQMGRNPLKRYLGLFMEKWIAPDFEKGLQQLKDYVEKLPYANLKPELIPVPATNYVSIRDTSSMATISGKMGAFYGELMAFLGQKNLQPSGPPFCVYYSWENNVFDMECAIPVEKPLPVPDPIRSGVMAAGNAVKVDFYGPYELTWYGHVAIEEWMKQNNKTRAGDPWETYITDPMSEKDPDKWLTVIYWPVR